MTVGLVFEEVWKYCTPLRVNYSLGECHFQSATKQATSFSMDVIKFFTGILATRVKFVSICCTVVNCSDVNGQYLPLSGVEINVLKHK